MSAWRWLISSLKTALLLTYWGCGLAGYGAGLAPDPDGVGWGFGLDFLGTAPVYPVGVRITEVEQAGGMAAASEAAAFSSLSFLKMTFLL